MMIMVVGTVCQQYTMALINISLGGNTQTSMWHNNNTRAYGTMWLLSKQPRQHSPEGSTRQPVTRAVGRLYVPRKIIVGVARTASHNTLYHMVLNSPEMWGGSGHRLTDEKNNYSMQVSVENKFCNRSLRHKAQNCFK